MWELDDESEVDGRVAGISVGGEHSGVRQEHSIHSQNHLLPSSPSIMSRVGSILLFSKLASLRFPRVHNLIYDLHLLLPWLNVTPAPRYYALVHRLLLTERVHADRLKRVRSGCNGL
jgi:hypothetical protein